MLNLFNQIIFISAEEFQKWMIIGENVQPATNVSEEDIIRAQISNNGDVIKNDVMKLSQTLSHLQLTK